MEPHSVKNYQVCEGTCEDKKAAARLCEFSNQLDLDQLLPVSARAHPSLEWELELQHAAINVKIIYNL